MKTKTDTTPYKGHFALYVTGLIVCLTVFVVSTLIAHTKQVAGWEKSLFLAINDWPEGLYRPMLIVTYLGSTWTAALSVVIAFLMHYYRLASRLALSVVIGYGLVFVFKHLVGRARPEDLIDGTVARIVETTMGYPSTHSAISVIIFLTLLPYLNNKWRWLVPLAIGCVMISRIYLGVHLPLDVIGGAALGATIVAFVRVLPQSVRVFLRID